MFLTWMLFAVGIFGILFGMLGVLWGRNPEVGILCMIVGIIVAMLPMLLTVRVAL